MNPTNTQLGPDYINQLIVLMLDHVGKGSAMAFRMFWDAGMEIFVEHLIVISIFLVAVLVYAAIRAWTGSVWMLGSVLYNYLYFATLFFIGLIFDPEIFASTFFKVALITIYAGCYILVGIILNKFVK